MIPKEKQERIKRIVSEQKGQEYPCSNQIVNRTIVLPDYSRIEAFEQAFPYFVCYRKTMNERRYINSKTEELYRTVITKENAKGFRYYKAIIDSTIDEGIFDAMIAPCMANYCCDVEFF